MENAMQSVVITAPQGAGKSQHATALMGAFGCSRLVDEWDGVAPLQDGDLALTNAEVRWQGAGRVLTLEQALAGAGAA